MAKKRQRVARTDELSVTESLPILQKARLPMWTLASVLICLLSLLAFLHFPNGLDLRRKLIDYDDLEVVKKMMDLEWKAYLTEWLPIRRHYAFPLRDLTIFFERMLSPQTEGQFWFGNFVFFALSVCFFALMVQRLFFSYPVLVIALLAVYALNPLQTEVIQWITCRKYLVGLVPVLVGTYFAIRWRGQELTKSRVGVLCGLWLLSIASYPTAVFWIFWLLFYIRRENPLMKMRIHYAALGLVAVGYLYLVGRGTGEVNSSLGSIFSAYEKSFHFGYNAIGRGFFNLLFPFWTYPYYREDHIFTFVGLSLFFLFAVALYRFLNSALRSSRSGRVGFYLTECVVWFVGGLVFIVPISNTVLGFFDFMLADRHFFFSLPFFVCSLGYFGLALREQSALAVLKNRVLVLGALCVWLGFSIFTIARKVPLWQNDFTLMLDCARNEKSARCMSQTVRRKFFKSECSAVNEILLQAANFYKNRPPFALEFNSELPFYHAACVALNSRIPREKKTEVIDGLTEFYGPSAEIIFGMVLANLENGKLNEAMSLAGQYYLGDLSLGPISATRTLQSIYAGQIAALCRLNPSDLCTSRLKNFLSLHLEANPNTGSGAWGKEATFMMAKRGRLTSN